MTPTKLRAVAGELLALADALDSGRPFQPGLTALGKGPQCETGENVSLDLTDGDGGAGDGTSIRVIAVVTDELTGEVVVLGADWWKHKRRWHYAVYDRTAAAIGAIVPEKEPT